MVRVALVANGRNWTRTPAISDASGAISEGCGAKCGALTDDEARAAMADPDLAAVVAAWPTLTESARAAIVAIIRGGD